MTPHAANRRAMAEDMAAEFWSQVPDDSRGLESLVWDLHDADPCFRLLIAQATGRDRDPSDETWLLFCSLIRQRVLAWRESRTAA